MKLFSFKSFRIFFLLGLLAYAAIYTQEQRLSTTSWYQTIPVVVYPINGDGHPDTAQYITTLTQQHFHDIEQFFDREAKAHRLISPHPIRTQLSSVISTMPPMPPADRNNVLAVIFWSLRLRYWAFQNTPDDLSNSNRIRLYVLYHQPIENQALPHSLGLQAGLIGVIHAFATPSQSKQNQIVMAHEILHTVGASDKYIRSGYPIYPDGFIKPNRQPRYPQLYAEVMAGRRALSATQAEMPSDLRLVKIGPKTAEEIRWHQAQF